MQQNKSETSGQKEQQTRIDDASGEKEADIMGATAPQTRIQKVNPHSCVSKTVQRTRDEESLINLAEDLKNSLNPLKSDRLNVVGEDFSKSEDRRAQEKEHAQKYTGSSSYWANYEFHTTEQQKLISTKLEADTFQLNFVDMLANRQIVGERMAGKIENPESQDINSVQENIELLTNELKQISRFYNMVEELKPGKSPSEREQRKKEKFWGLSSHWGNILQNYFLVYASYLHNIKHSQMKHLVVNNPTVNYLYKRLRGHLNASGIAKEVRSDTKDNLSNYKASLDALENALEQQKLISTKLEADTFQLNFVDMLANRQIVGERMAGKIENPESQDINSVQENIELLTNELKQISRFYNMVEELKPGKSPSEREQRKKEKFWGLSSHWGNILQNYFLVYASYLHNIKHSQMKHLVVDNPTVNYLYKRLRGHLNIFEISKEVLNNTKDNLSNYKASLNALENALEQQKLISTKPENEVSSMLNKVSSYHERWLTNTFGTKACGRSQTSM